MYETATKCSFTKFTVCCFRRERMCIGQPQVWRKRSVWQHRGLVLLPVLPGLCWRRTLLFWSVMTVMWTFSFNITQTLRSTCKQKLWSTAGSSNLSMLPDIDECHVNNGYCEHNCTNEPGGYRCQCASGYQLDLGEHNCTGKARDRMDIIDFRQNN